MKIFVRVDASLSVGTGHLFRCLNLADVLRARGCSILFAVNVSELNFHKKIIDRGHKVVRLNLSHSKTGNNGYELLQNSQLSDALECSDILEDYQPDLLVVDHYHLDYRWERVIKLKTKKILVIDDLANRKHDCDILLDQTPIRWSQDYNNLVKKSTKLLIGLNYSILHSDYTFYREKNSTRAIEFKNLLIGVGGLDSNNLIPKILNCIQQNELVRNQQINVLLSSIAPQINLIKKHIDSLPLNVKLHTDSKKFVQLIASADFAISAGGLMSLELACLGVPAVIIPLTQIQSTVSNKLSEEVDFLVIKNWLRNFDSKLASNFKYLIGSFSTEKERRLHGELDGLGTTRVVDCVIKLVNDV